LAKDSGLPQSAAALLSGHAGTRRACVPQTPILLVEDSKFIARLVKQSLQAELGCPVHVAYSMAETAAFLDSCTTRPWAAVVDLELPDAVLGEVVEVTTRRGVPTIVLTATYANETRERIWAKGIVDYFIKGDNSLQLLNQRIRRLLVNPQVAVLCVDDSSAYRHLYRRLLSLHLFQVLSAEVPAEGLRLLEENPNIKVVITDYEMPGMNGIELVQEIRQKKSSDELAIIGFSSLSVADLPAMFLKFGADDFVAKPFVFEEFYCRMYRCLESLEAIEKMRLLAFSDQLTQLHNRLSFFDVVPDWYEATKSKGEPLSMAMVDVDFFKKINDNYGHAVGDTALRVLADMVREVLPDSTFCARWGGEEFCIVLPGTTASRAREVTELLREGVEASSFEAEGQVVQFTISVGLTATLGHNLEAMINRADNALYRAKTKGRNQVVVE
jgi:diguanylate cyclase (GGDEF)-like protein